MLIVGLDLETTGLEPSEHRIVEVSAQVWDTRTRTRRINFIQRIDPQRSIAAAAQAVHRISSADLIGKPLWEEVAPKVQKIIAHCELVVAHNGDGFDKPFLTSELKRVGLKMPPAPWFDTMLQGRWAQPTGAIPSLQALCFACDVDYDAGSAHNAEYDVTVMMECFFRGLDWGSFQMPEGLAEKFEKEEMAA